jgi:pimeloyl-ACP methyl ester carboxylesterase
MALHVERDGDAGPTVVLIHGNGPPGWGAWDAARPLADRYRLVVPHRGGYPPNPPLDRIDFGQQADELAELVEPGSHLVGHSYGGVIALIMAGRIGERLRSLTVVEPPALGLVRGNPAAETIITELQRIPETAGDPRTQLVAFLRAVGSTTEVPDPLPPGGAQLVQAGNAQRQPWEALFDFAAIRAAGMPVLVITGGHSDAFEAIGDVIERELRAERAVLPGRGHSVQRVGAAFNSRLAAFIDEAERRAVDVPQ